MVAQLRIFCCKAQTKSGVKVNGDGVFRAGNPNVVLPAMSAETRCRQAFFARLNFVPGIEARVTRRLPS
jgi:hypothetical protein